VGLYIEPVCRIVRGRYAAIVGGTSGSGVEGSGRNLVDVFRLACRLVDDYGANVTNQEPAEVAPSDAIQVGVSTSSASPLR
jgi:hypothetical protein